MWHRSSGSNKGHRSTLSSPTGTTDGNDDDSTGDVPQRRASHNLAPCGYLIGWFTALLVSLLVSYIIWGATIYYKIPSQYAIQQREIRHHRALVQGMSYLRSLSPDDLAHWSTNRTSTATTPHLCVAIYTNPRRVPYVQALMASILHGTNTNDIGTTNVVIHIVTSASPTGVAALDDLAVIRTQLPFVQMHAIPHDPTRSLIDNFNRNYATLLEIGVQTGASWIIALEDDTIVCRNFVARFQQLVTSDHFHTLDWDRLAFFKLFVSDRWDGFENKDIGWIVVSCVVAGMLATAWIACWGRLVRLVEWQTATRSSTNRRVHQKIGWKSQLPTVVGTS